MALFLPSVHMRAVNVPSFGGNRPLRLALSCQKGHQNPSQLFMPMTYPIEIRPLRSLLPGQPRISALFSFRYDSHLVPDLIENLTPLVHEAIVWDDRGAHGTHSNEPQRRNRLLQAARAHGTDWILTVDPDERFEAGLADRISAMTREKGRRVLWTFALREMFSANAWRDDGIWGHKTQIRLFPIHAVQDELTEELHGRWVQPREGYRQMESGLNLYHFNHLSPERGQARRDTYAKADPERKYNVVGYDYLADRRGMVLKEIPPRRKYQPLWREDGAGWMPPATSPGLKGDPDHVRLRFMERSLHQKGRGAAALWAQDMAGLQPDDPDLAAMARILGPQENAYQPDLWRRWIKGSARLSEGPKNGRGPLTVIILGLRAPKELRQTVDAVLAQSDETEIVLVNSGGGDVARLLGARCAHLRLIEVEEPLFVGAARNIGMDASAGRWVSFLAADCVPEPGWVAARLTRHQAGAVSVATAVIPQRPGSLVAALTWSMRFHSRDPGVDAEKAQLFGRSYDRQAMRRVGYFPPARRQGEDDDYNARMDKLEPVVWAPEIVVRHHDPRTAFGSILDAWRRGNRARLPVNVSRKQAEQRRINRLKQFRQSDLPAEFRLGFVGSFLLPLTRWLFVRAYLAGLSRSLPRHFRAEGLRQKAISLLGKGRGEALAVAEKAMAEDPQSAPIWATLGDCQARFGTEAASLDAWRKALELAPTRSGILDQAVEYLLAEGQADRALAFAESALILAPAEPGLRRVTARAALAMGDKPRALEHLRWALAHDPAKADLHLELAELYEALGDSTLGERRRRMAQALLDSMRRSK